MAPTPHYGGSEPVSEWCREEMAEAAQAVQVARLWCRWVVFHQCGHFLMNYCFSATIRTAKGCTGVLASQPHTQEISLLITVLRLLHPPVLLKLSHFPAMFTQAIILICILYTGPHTVGVLQGWTDDCSYFSIFKSMSCSISLHLRGSLHHRLVNADIFLNPLKNKHAVPSRPVAVVQAQQPDLQNKQVGDIWTN